MGSTVADGIQLAMHNWMRPEPIAVTLGRLAKCGYDSLEIAGLPDEYDTRQVARLLDEFGLSCWGGVTMMEDGLSLISPDEAVRARSVDYVKDVVTMVKELDGRVVTVIPGEIGKLESRSTPEDEWRWAVESMREVYEHATPAGIRLAIEPINRSETHFINRIDQALALAEAVGAECGVCPDTFHLNIEERDPLQAITAAGSRIADFHVSDSNQDACGTGHLDWRPILETLRATGYDGAIAVEFVPTIDRTPINPNPDSIEDYSSRRTTESHYTSMVRQSARVLRPLMA
jgi:sugar phosphate isomerase/epimerase